MNFLRRHQQIWHSFRSLPLWVQIWVLAVLVPVNTTPFFLLDTWTGRAAAAAARFVLLTNAPIMYYYAGMSRLMSVPHLLAWMPLEIALALRILGDVGPEPISDAELHLAWALLLVNGVSLVFDFIDSWRWIAGQREVPGRPQSS